MSRPTARSQLKLDQARQAADRLGRGFADVWLLLFGTNNFASVMCVRIALSDRGTFGGSKDEDEDEDEEAEN